MPGLLSDLWAYSGNLPLRLLYFQFPWDRFRQSGLTGCMRELPELERRPEEGGRKLAVWLK
jgi:hypothetical protein